MRLVRVFLSWVGGLLGTFVLGTWLTAWATHHSFTSIVTWIWRTIVEVLKLGVPLWVVLLILGFMFLVSRPRRRAVTQTREPTVFQYREDVFDGILWKWRITSVDDLEVDFERQTPIPFCSRCREQFVVHHVGDSTVLYCEGCGQRHNLYGDLSTMRDSVRRKIAGIVHRGEWRSRLGGNAGDDGQGANAPNN